MVQFWKFRREVSRIGRQVSSFAGTLKAAALRPAWDRVRPRAIRIDEGALPGGSRVALVLVFQPKGCPESLWAMLDHIRARGFAVLLVSNGRLKSADLERSRAVTWRVLQRPNLGYDFGGYGDGIWYLRRTGVEVDRLLVANDTLWWPAVDDPHCLDRLLALDADYAGLCNFPYRPGRRRPTGLTGRHYVSSFCFVVSGRVWRSRAFAEYWAGMPLYGQKPKVVERGEVGFSDRIASAGFVPQVLVDHRSLLREVATMSDARAEAFLARLPVLGGAVRPRVEAALARLADGTAYPGEARAVLRDIMPTLNPWDSLAVNGLTDGRIDFVKKANLRSPDNAARFLAMCDAASVALDANVRAEIAAIAGPLDAAAA